MVSHIVLFRLKPDADREALAAALADVLRQIPSIRRFHIGRRVRTGRDYERAMIEDLEYGAVIEFDDMSGLTAYFEHPAHDELSARFVSAMAAAAIYDYEMVDGTRMGDLLAGS